MKNAEDILRDKTPRMVSVTPDASIYEAIEMMVAHGIGAILIQENDDITGIWTERDFLRNSLDPRFDPKSARITEYMQTRPKTAPHDTPILNLLEMFLGLYVRHLLIVKGEKYLGLLSTGDVIRASLLEKDRDLRKLNKMVSWEYYENWGWQKKHEEKK